MPTGCSMSFLMKEIPNRAFDVGIAEAHAVTFSAGLAKEGFVPFCNIYSSFMQRAYDQVIHDVALQNLNVIMCLDRAGLVGEDGPTHHGVFDLAYLRPIPNLIISAPLNEHDLRNLMYTATYDSNQPFVIRYPRGKGEMVNWKNTMQSIPIGKGRKLREGQDIALLSIGTIGNNAAKAIAEATAKGISVAHYDMLFLKPIDQELLKEVAENFKHIITLENGVIKGGLGSAVLEYLAENNYSEIKVHRMGIDDCFITHGTIPELQKIARIDEKSILQKIEEVYAAITPSSEALRKTISIKV